jgi:ribose transport system ATP-binding protein
LKLEHISKRYPGVQALDSVDFQVEAGTVHALVGENGAGKSTLLKVIAGAEAPDQGTITLDGQPYVFRNPRAALVRGITVIYQELTLVPQLGADANIFLGMEMSRRGILDRETMRDAAAEALHTLGLYVDPSTPVSQLSIAQQQLVELARALVRNARVIALDEPTATLTTSEVTHLFQQVDRLKSQGVGIVFVSHRLDEVRTLADRVTVLRDGVTVWSGPIDEVDDGELIRFMVGRDVEYVRLQAAQPPDPTALLEVRQLSKSGSFEDVSFSVHPGEIVAFAGLVGAGRTGMARCLAGADRWDEGTVQLAGQTYRPRSPRDAIARGIVYLPEDRKRDGLILGFKVGENTTLPVLDRFVTLGGLNRTAEHDAAQQAIARAQVRPLAVDRVTSTLSGGNQQKVVLAKWLLADADLLIFDEPTRGVDVGGKVELHRQIRALADEGKGVVVISSEMPEVLALADRVIVMREGRVTGEVSGTGAKAEDIMSLAVAG